jgi:hypothetical protein
MLGAILAGVVIDAGWFDQKHVDMMRHRILLAVMPFFCAAPACGPTGASAVRRSFVAAAALLVAAGFNSIPA